MIQLDNLAVQGMANGTISFFSNVMQGLQGTYGTNADGWLNVINDLDDIIYADHLRSTGINATDTSLYQSYSIVNNRTHFSDRSNVDYMNVGGNVNTTNGVIAPHYGVLLPAKSFAGNITANASALDNFITNTLDNNNTYSSSNVISSKQYAIDNGFVSTYTSLDNTSFDTSGIAPQLQEVAEVRLAVIKTSLVNNKFID
jgi:hypothetical protein